MEHCDDHGFPAPNSGAVIVCPCCTEWLTGAGIVRANAIPTACAFVHALSFTTIRLVQFLSEPEKRLTTQVQFAIEMMALYRGQVSSLSREHTLL